MRKPRRRMLVSILAIVTLLILLSISFPFPVTAPPTLYTWNPNVTCAPTLVTVQDVLGTAYPSQSLSGSPWQTNDTTGGVPSKRALSPPCTITNTSGQVVSTFVQINGIYIVNTKYEPDCRTSYWPVNGGGPYPDLNGDGSPDKICDTTGNIYTVGTSSGRIHIEFDMDWMAAGYCGPFSIYCNNNTIAQYISTGSISLDVQGFVYWDGDHTGWWELHPFTAWKLSSDPPPTPGPLSPSFTYSPANPAAGVSVSFTGSATGGFPPYSYSWNFGDGGTATGAVATHVYSSPGTYTSVFAVTDSSSQTATFSRSVPVTFQSTITLSPTDDAYVRNDQPSSNFGSTSTVVVDNVPIKNILLKFNATFFGTATSAKLRLYQIDSSWRGGDLHTSATNWSEKTVTWNNAPAADTAVTASLGSVVANTWYELDVSSVVTGPGVYSFKMTSTIDDGAYYTSKEGAAEFGPQLVITLTQSDTPPALTAPVSTAVNENYNLEFTVSATDDPAQTVTITADGIPAGASFSSTPSPGYATGAFTWTPNELQGGETHFVTFTATDGEGLSSTTTTTISVSEFNVAPTVTVPGPQAVATGQTLTFTVTGSDPDIPADTITLSATGLVAGMSFNSFTGEFSFAPTIDQAGQTFTVGFTAADDGEPPLSDTNTVDITVVTSGNNQPVLNPIGNKSVDELSSLNFTATASDFDGDTLTFSIIGAPAGANFDLVPGAFTWTPTEAQGPGAYTITITVSDGSLTDSETLTITVNEVNTAPILEPVIDYAIDEGTPLAFSATASDSDLPTNTLTFSFADGPSGASITPSGAFTWTPTESQGPGTYSVTIRVTDNGTPALSMTQGFTITVSEINSAPSVTAPASATVEVGSTLTFTVAATDGDIPANVVTLAASGLVSGMSFPIVNGNPVSGMFSFTPDETQVGTSFSVTFAATDNGVPSASANSTMAITVVPRANYALVIAKDGSVFRYYQNGTLAFIGRPTNTQLRAVAWTPDGSYALIVGDKATLIKYDGSQFAIITTGISTSRNFYAIAWKPDGSYALIAGTSGILFKYDGVSVTTVPNPYATTIRSISWHPSGNSAIIVGRNGLMLSWNGSGLTAIPTGTSAELYAVAWNPNGQYALAGGKNGVIIRYDGVATLIPTSGLFSASQTVKSIAWNPSGSLALIVGDGGLVLTYDGSSLVRLASPTGGNLYGVSWAGETATIVGSGGKILRYSSGTLTNVVSGTTTSLYGIAWKPF